MQFRKMSLVGGLVGLGLLATMAGTPRPASAGSRNVPYVVGSYFGQFVSASGNHDAADFNITVQDGRRIGGVMNIAGRVQGLPFSGTIGRNRITITGRLVSGPNRTQVSLSANVSFNGPGEITTLDGTYRLKTRRQERGTITFGGVAQEEPEPPFDPR